MKRGRFAFVSALGAGAAALALSAAVLIADRLFPPPLERARDVSRVALDRHGERLHAFTTPEGRWRFPARTGEIDPVFLERLILIEDKRFYRHPGVDLRAVARAGLQSAKAGRVVSGASTITMQTARLLEPRSRTLGAKLIEMLRALQIERRLSKDEILALYLTLAPYGGNIEGARAASLLYFGKEPARLSDAEQALLIALPQAPEARRPDRGADAAARSRADILGRLAESGAIDERSRREASEAPVPTHRIAQPTRAYHAARRLASSDEDLARTTIDAALQEEAEALAARAAASLADGAALSMLIIETESRAVRAAIGAAERSAPGGWMDLTAALRSPGSALKPFIYARALDDGKLGPATVIDDMPRAFGDYAPENFDRRFRGEVRMNEALRHSLNVPAVAALDAVGPDAFAARIRAAGADIRAPEARARLGLALALGGAGVTAQDLGLLYATLSEGGLAKPLRWRESDPMPDSGYRLFSERTARAILEILEGGPALPGRAPAALAERATPIAFKTGTSYGYRDAWAAGVSGGYVAIIWVGRADGAPRPGETGRKATAPLLFDLFDLLDRRGALSPRPRLEPAGEGARLARLRPGAPPGPQIVFPKDGIELYTDDRGVSLAARGGEGALSWYVDGAPVQSDGPGGRAVWRPQRSGFFDLAVIDGEGRAARSKVRVRRAP